MKLPVIVNNFLQEDERKLLSIYCELMHRNPDIDNCFGNEFESYQISHGADVIMDSLLIKKRDLMSQTLNKELIPTYSYWRCYTHGSDLTKHTDRPACEYSVTVSIDHGGEPWPIFVDGIKCDLDKGDAAIYAGIDQPHWRERYKGDWCMQVFLHYVDKNGPHKEHAFDKRPWIGFKG
jgi:hypothetical protein